MGAGFAANKMIDAATLDRLRHGAYKLVLDGEAIVPSRQYRKGTTVEKGVAAANRRGLAGQGSKNCFPINYHSSWHNRRERIFNIRGLRN